MNTFIKLKVINLKSQILKKKFIFSFCLNQTSLKQKEKMNFVFFFRSISIQFIPTRKVVKPSGSTRLTNSGPQPLLGSVASF